LIIGKKIVKKLV